MPRHHLGQIVQPIYFLFLNWLFEVVLVDSRLLVLFLQSSVLIFVFVAHRFELGCLFTDSVQTFQLSVFKFLVFKHPLLEFFKPS